MYNCTRLVGVRLRVMFALLFPFATLCILKTLISIVIFSLLVTQQRQPIHTH